MYLHISSWYRFICNNIISYSFPLVHFSNSILFLPSTIVLLFSIDVILVIGNGYAGPNDSEAIRGLVKYRISIRNASSTQILLVHYLFLSYPLVLKFCTAHDTVRRALCKISKRLKKMSWTNQISCDLSLRCISDGYPIMDRASGEYGSSNHLNLLETDKITQQSKMHQNRVHILGYILYLKYGWYGRRKSEILFIMWNPINTPSREIW